jgi:hypothetical protein
VVNSTPRPLYPRERDPVPIVWEAGWAPGPVWTAAKNLAPTGIRFPDRSARSESLYRLRWSSNTQSCTGDGFISSTCVFTCQSPFHQCVLPNFHRLRLVRTAHTPYWLWVWAPIWRFIYDLTLGWAHTKDVYCSFTAAYFVFLMSISMLSFHLLLGFPNSRSLRDFPTNICHNSDIFCHNMICILAHTTALYFICLSMLHDLHERRASSLCKNSRRFKVFGQVGEIGAWSANYIHLGSEHFSLSTSFSNTRYLFSFVTILGHVSHPHITTAKLLLFLRMPTSQESGGFGKQTGEE